MQTNLNKVSDQELWKKCQEYGANARAWAKKFAALLPEVERRQLYKQHGFYSIFEFAAKLAGMGRETVVEILRVARRLENVPALLAEMETQGWGKLRVVATIATPENEKILAEKVREMSLGTLATFVQEIRKQNHPIVQNRIDSATSHEQSECAFSAADAYQNAFSESRKSDADILTEAAAVNKQPPRITVRIPLKPQTELRLRKLKKKLSQAARAPVDFNEVMETLLDTYEKLALRSKAPRAVRKANRAPPAPEQSPASASANQHERSELNAAKEQIQRELPKISSRYIPAKVKHFLDEGYGGRCAYPYCTNLSEIYHHTRRFSLSPNHDPDFLAPLCKNHERLAHHGLIENEEKAPNEWNIIAKANTSTKKYQIDQKVNELRTML